MRKDSFAKIMLLTSLGLGSVGLLGGCGGGTTTTETVGSAPEDLKQTQKNMDNVKAQYEKKNAAAPK